MKKALSVVAAILFAAAYLFASISTCYDHKFDGILFNYFYCYDGVFIFTRYIIVFAVLFLLTYFNKRNHRFISIFIPIAMTLLTACILIDRFYTHHLMYNYYLCLWQCAAIIVANAAVFLSATLFFDEGYREFYRSLWWAFAGIYLFLIYIAFIRSPNSYALSINMHVGSGTLKFFRYMIHHLNDGYIVLICIGNILVFAPVPFMLRNVLPKAPFYVFLIIGFLIPIAAEAYQYIFQCGNVDIDDLLLNWLGFAIGLGLEELIFKKKLCKK